MANVVCLHDRGQLESFFRRDAFSNVYALGDLDDSFWPYTTWYGLADGERLRAVALVYSGLTLPTILCTGAERDLAAQEEVLRSVMGLLPRRFYCHLTCWLSGVFDGRYRLEPHGPHQKMALVDPARLPRQDDADVTALSPPDLDEVQAFYSRHYPGNWFEPQMLDTNQYCGLRVGRELVCVAGVHVCSRAYRVAALGNIATAPAFRRKGYARRVTGQLCRRLLKSADHIGLNARAENAAAIDCYASLGFARISVYEEFMADGLDS
jgi:ribosomal protein S18 acetylase RimI-like enzyme